MIPIGETHDGRADMTNFEMDLFDTRMHSTKMDKEEEQCCSGSASRRQLIKPACLPISVLSLLIIALVFLPLFKDEDLEAPDKMSLTSLCSHPCGVRLAETIPTGLSLSRDHQSTASAWLDLIQSSQHFLDISSFYWTLKNDTYPTADKGRSVLSAIVEAARRGVKVRIVQNSSSEDSAWLSRNGYAKVRTLNFSSLLGGGVLHTKFLISDMRRVYIGSANMDWRSLAEVKELGAVMSDCPCVAADLYRVFAVYWRLGEEGAVIPEKWPISYRTQYSLRSPMPIDLEFFDAKKKVEKAELFISSSPIPFNPKGRQDDLDSIVSLIGEAKFTVCVSVMDFLPQTLYMRNNSYWHPLDVALRSAAFRGVQVRLLISSWKFTIPATLPFLRSLLAINEAIKGNVSIKMFRVPADAQQERIDHARVNHAKYMVADGTAYIGTSNWAGDYFINTAGVGLVIRSAMFSSQLQEVFDRDWDSQYASLLPLK